MPQELANSTPQPGRWMLIRDVLVLQFKLIVDGMRDFLLVPASLIAGFLSLVSGRDGKPGSQFYRLLGLGKQSEQWIDLFEAYKRLPDSVEPGKTYADVNFDNFIKRIESFVVDEYERGGVTAQAKKRIDAALNAMQRRAREKGSEL